MPPAPPCEPSSAPSAQLCPAAIAPLEPGEAYDLPSGARRRKQLAKGIELTVVNGQILIEKGEHSGAYPGKVARSVSIAQ